MKFVAPLNPDEISALEYLYKNHPKHRTRLRAQALLMSHKGYSIPDLCDMLDLHRNALMRWMNNWKSQGVDSLTDAPRTGRPPILDEDDCMHFKTLIDANPHQPKTAIALFQELTGKTAHPDTFKRVLKKNLSLQKTA